MATKAQGVQAIGAVRTPSVIGAEMARPASADQAASAAWSVRSGRAIWAEWLKSQTCKRALFASGDAAALVIAHIFAKASTTHLLHITSDPNPHGYWLFYLPFLLGVLYLLEGNHNPNVRRPEKELELAVKGTSFAFLLLVCANFVVFKATIFSRYLMVTWYASALALVLAARFGLRRFYGALWKQGLARPRTLLLGTSERLSQFQSLLTIQRHNGYEIIGAPIDESFSEQASGSAVPVEQRVAGWRKTAAENGVEQVVVCLPRTSSESHRIVSRVLETFLPAGIDVQVYSDLFASRKFNYELDEFSGFFRFFAAPMWTRSLQAAAKRALDIAAGLVGSAITVAVLPLAAMLIKMEDGGPVFYSSEFLDTSGKIRHYRKFRSMHTNAAEMLECDAALKAKFAEKQKLVHDPRVTRIGRVLRKYSIDELPEFFSVLKGELSLVGPRTICRREAARYGELLPKLLSARPGLTGFWQVMGRQLTTYDERVQMDMFYVDHWSIWLDLWIVAKTFWKVLRAEGAY